MSLIAFPIFDGLTGGGVAASVLFTSPTIADPSPSSTNAGPSNSFSRGLQCHTRVVLRGKCPQNNSTHCEKSEGGVSINSTLCVEKWPNQVRIMTHPKIHIVRRRVWSNVYKHTIMLKGSILLHTVRCDLVRVCGAMVV